MTVYASFKGASSAMVPTTPTLALNGSVFIDSTNGNALSYKSPGEVITVIGATSSSDIMIKLKQNLSGVEIAANKEVALKPDGSIGLADNDGINLQTVIGITTEAIANNAFGRVLLYGPNASGAVSGLAFTSGEAILLSNIPGTLTNSMAGMNPAINTIMKVGVADCASGICSGTATDLIMISEVMSRPTGGL